MLLLIAATTVKLSERTRIDFFDQCRPQMATARTTGTSSLVAMKASFSGPAHCSWSQLGSQIAPHPQEPEASVVIVKCGAAEVADSKKETPFQHSIKRNHHSKSDRASEFKRIKWSSFFPCVERSINLRKKILLIRTTLLACANSPISESNSLFLQAFR